MTGPRSPYTPEQKAAALNAYRDHGPTEAARRTGIPKGTISAWARRDGVQTAVVANMGAAVATAALNVHERKLAAADEALDSARRVLAQLFEPSVEKKIVTIAGGLQHDGRWAVAEVERAKPTYAEQARIATTFAILVDKVQILTGGATQRFGTEGGDSEVREVAAQVLKLVKDPKAEAS